MAGGTIGDPFHTPGAAPDAVPAGGGGSGAGSDLIDNTRNRTLIVIYNGSASTRTITIARQTLTNPADYPVGRWPDINVPAITKSLAAGATAAFYGIPNAYNDADGKLHVAYDEIADMTISANEIVKI